MCTYDLLLVKVEEGINSDISDSLCGLYYDVSVCVYVREISWSVILQPCIFRSVNFCDPLGPVHTGDKVESRYGRL